MSNRSNNRKKLERWYKAQKGRCIYCGVKTFLPISGDQGISPDNMATLEHVFSRNNIISFIISPQVNTRMACFRCNNTAEQIETREIYQFYNALGPHKINIIYLLKKTIMNQETERLLNEAANEIQQLRRIADIQAARLGMFDDMMLLLRSQPPQMGMGMGEDVVGKIERHIRDTPKDDDPKEAPGFFVRDNSDAFRDFLKDRNIEFRPGGHGTRIFGNVDPYSLGGEFLIYTQKNKPQ